MISNGEDGLQRKLVGNFNIFEFPGGGWGPDPRPDPQSLDTCMALAFLDYFDLPKTRALNDNKKGKCSNFKAKRYGIFLTNHI